MNKTNYITRLFSIAIVLIIVAAMTVAFSACEKKDTPEETKEVTETASDTSAATDAKKVTDTKKAEITITVLVVSADGSGKNFTINTVEDNLGAALLDEKLVEGEIGAYGLYIKSVNGEVADYDTDKAYWALSKNGEYLMTGADTTPIADGDKFELTYTKE